MCILNRAAVHRRNINFGSIPPAIQKNFLDVSKYNQTVENIRKLTPGTSNVQREEKNFYKYDQKAVQR